MELFAARKHNVRAPNAFYCIAPSRDVSQSLRGSSATRDHTLSDSYQPLVLGWYSRQSKALTKVLKLLHAIIVGCLYGLVMAF